MAPKDEFRSGGEVTRRIFIQKTLIAGAAVSIPWLWISRPSFATGTPELEVQSVFTQAVRAFNDKNASALRNCFDSKVMLLKIHSDHPHYQMQGPDEVINYLSNAWNGPKPVTMIFNPDYNGNSPSIKIFGPNDSKAKVTGLACWKDSDESPTDRDGQLNYDFELQNSNGKWLITKLSGQYTTNPPKQCS